MRLSEADGGGADSLSRGSPAGIRRADAGRGESPEASHRPHQCRSACRNEPRNAGAADPGALEPPVELEPPRGDQLDEAVPALRSLPISLSRSQAGDDMLADVTTSWAMVGAWTDRTPPLRLPCRLAIHRSVRAASA